MATNGNAQLPVAEPWVIFKKLAAVFPLLQEAHYTFITRAAEGRYSRKRSRNTDPHAPELLRFLRTYLNRQDLPGPADIQLPSREVATLLAMARRTRNILLYGPPGTGKTWTAREFAKHFLGGEGAAFEGRKRFVTFHQSFAYEEFVEGLKPETGAGESGIRYNVVPGVFREMCKTAEKAWRQHQEARTPGEAPRFLLIIDEINRANIAKVFGELITLIEDDKRLGEANAITVTLPYSGEAFSVPPNLYILGTLNTADRSIALLDLALRRRFAFCELPPNPALLDKTPSPVPGLNLSQLLIRLNERIAALLDRDHRLGHSYFYSVRDLDDLHFAWYHRVIPLLEEYFYGDGGRLRAVLGPAFVQKTQIHSATQKALGELYDGDATRYSIGHLEGQEFIDALQALATGAVAAAQSAGVEGAAALTETET
jgi:5-methylcytosine-specific restriction endonuclease McrBC GTP-binding regulatory subunit McrB